MKINHVIKIVNDVKNNDVRVSIDGKHVFPLVTGSQLDKNALIMEALKELGIEVQIENQWIFPNIQSESESKMLRQIRSNYRSEKLIVEDYE